MKPAEKILCTLMVVAMTFSAGIVLGEAIQSSVFRKVERPEHNPQYVWMHLPVNADEAKGDFPDKVILWLKEQEADGWEPAGVPVLSGSFLMRRIPWARRKSGEAWK